MQRVCVNRAAALHSGGLWSRASPRLNLQRFVYWCILLELLIVTVVSYMRVGLFLIGTRDFKLWNSIISLLWDRQVEESRFMENCYLSNILYNTSEEYRGMASKSTKSRYWILCWFLFDDRILLNFKTILNWYLM